MYMYRNTVPITEPCHRGRLETALSASLAAGSHAAQIQRLLTLAFGLVES